MENTALDSSRVYVVGFVNHNCSAVVRHSARVRLVHDSFRPKYAAQWYVVGLAALSRREICGCAPICV